ncbi:MAG: extracellular solute-binding protein [Acidobacteria bacterium]|nr:extracellular solute-binding protein [Acidobacteriota bacterium]
MSEQLRLTGMTWNHSRAYPPLVAAAQRFEEENPGVAIDWERRSLDDFGHAPLAPMARAYDLLVIDHPMLGDASGQGILLPLDDLLPQPLLADLETNSVGPSFGSYRYDGRLWALPLDAAAPVASYRPDLLDRAGLCVPRNWDEVLSVAQEGLAVMPAFPADLYLNFLGLYHSLGGMPQAGPEAVLDRGTGVESLLRLHALAALMPERIYALNPILVYESLARTDEFAYCPFAYSYSNYARPGFAAHPVLFTDLADIRPRTPMNSALGGTGLALSAQCRHREAALRFAAYVTGETCQRTLYVQTGGQPAHRQAWLDGAANALTHNFFSQTLTAMKRSFVRPRHPGYVAFQQRAGHPIVEFLRAGGNPEAAVDELNRLYLDCGRSTAAPR